MELKEMCRILHPYTCPACGNNMLFFTRARNNNVIDYKNLMETKNQTEMMEYLGEKDVEYLKCVICNKMYIIDWTKEFARPLLFKNTLIRFGYKFKE